MLQIDKKITIKSSSYRNKGIVYKTVTKCNTEDIKDLLKSKLRAQQDRKE